MAFTFSASGISASGTDYISFSRFKIGDTVAPGEVSDEIFIALYNDTSGTQTARNYQTAIAAANYLYTLYTKQFNFSSAGTSVQYQERAKSFLSLIEDLIQEYLAATGASAVLYPYRPDSYCDADNNYGANSPWRW